MIEKEVGKEIKCVFTLRQQHTEASLRRKNTREGAEVFLGQTSVFFGGREEKGVKSR